MRAAGFSLQQSHSLPGGRSHTSMLFITLNKHQGPKQIKGETETTATRGGLRINHILVFFSLRLCVLFFKAALNNDFNDF